MAWMAGLHATGIELSRMRWAASQTALAALHDLAFKSLLPPGGRDCSSGLPTRCESGMRLLHCSFFQVDFTDADFLFVASTMFTKAMVAKIAKSASRMKPGSRIISFHGLTDLGQFGQFPGLVEIGEIIAATSWSASTCWKIHEVVDSA